MKFINRMFCLSLLLVTICIAQGNQFVTSTWNKTLSPTVFSNMDTTNRKATYYFLRTDSTGQPFIHAQYVHPEKTVKLAYKLHESFSDVEIISWQWRVLSPPNGANEWVKGKFDCGAALYFVFNDNLQMCILKYVYSTALPVGTVIRKDPFYPLRKMFVIVTNTWNEADRQVWKKVSVDVQADYKRLFKSKNYKK